jgi:hypothetical protein
MIRNKWTEALSLFAFMSCLGVNCECDVNIFVKYECIKVLVPRLWCPNGLGAIDTIRAVGRLFVFFDVLVLFFLQRCSVLDCLLHAVMNKFAT